MRKKILPLYNNAKLYKLIEIFKVTLTNVLPPFYGSQCVYKTYRAHNIRQLLLEKTIN